MTTDELAVVSNLISFLVLIDAVVLVVYYQDTPMTYSLSYFDSLTQ